MSKQAFDKKIEELHALREARPSDAADQIRRALKERGNYVVAAAVDAAVDLNLTDLIPDLLAQFDRFMTNADKTDPQCWAKNALAKALKDFGYRDPDVFVRGIKHIQMEPVWGGSADSATTLRGTCALALVHTNADDSVIMTHLTDALTDPEKPVRAHAAAAIGEMGRPEGILLLRLKALVGDAEPEVIAQCFASLMELAPHDSIEFIARFLRSPNEEIGVEAGSALAQSREPKALETVKIFWEEVMSPELRRALVISLGASPLADAAEFLLLILNEDPGEIAVTALTALGTSRYKSQMLDRVAASIKYRKNAKLKRIFEESFLEAGED